MLKKKRADVQIVGDELHPLGKVQDFSPYVAKIKASGADSVITGNWGNDLSLLVKAAKDAGLNVDWYTYYAGGLSTPAAIGQAGKDRVKQITEWHSNVEAAALDEELDALQEEVQRGLLLPAHPQPRGDAREGVRAGEVGRSGRRSRKRSRA